jgi:hypothetical protein
MAVDRGAIDAQLREIGEGERWWEQREFRDLPYILHADERLLGLATGKLLGRRRPRVRARRWLFVVTGQRLICLSQRRFARNQVEIPISQIIRLQQGNGLRSHQITIQTPERRYRLRVSSADAYRFATALVSVVPDAPRRVLHPDLEALSWIPGIRTVAALPAVSGIISKVSSLSPPENPAHAQIERLEATVDRLQEDVERLQQQVSFLENLLQKQQESAFLPSAGASRPAHDS